MDVLCVGMYRSGSTWQYDVACHLVEQYRCGSRLGYVDASHYEARGTCWRVLKSHDYHPAFAAALESGRALALYSYRDLRDVAYSLMHKHAASFEDIVERRQMLHRCLENDGAWRARPRTLVQRYEQIMAQPMEAVQAIARHLDIALNDGEVEAVAEKYSLSANRQRTERLTEELRDAGVDLEDPANAERWDAETLLHWNHIRAGRIGDWQGRATPRELAVLAGICGQWLIENNYEPDLAWALPALEHLAEELERTQMALYETRQELADAVRELSVVRESRWSNRLPKLARAMTRLLRMRS